MCTFNGAKFLGEQLDSIVQQTELPDELVVCDDGSSDQTVDILRTFARTAPFPTFIHQNSVNLRFAQNFVKCIGLCSGQIIVMTDQDDIWKPLRIAETRAAFAQDQALTFTFSDAELIDEFGQDLHQTIYANVKVLPWDRAALKEGRSMLPIIARSGIVYGCTMAFRARYLPSILPLPDLWSHDEWISLLLSSFGPSARLTPVTRYRQHAVQLAGAGPMTLQIRLNRARRLGIQLYQRELLHCEAALKVLEQRPELYAKLLPIIRDKAAFIRTRIHAQDHGFRGWPIILRQLQQRRYHQFAFGIRSAAKDAALSLGFFRGHKG